jgi:hypothetical protein
MSLDLTLLVSLQGVADDMALAHTMLEVVPTERLAQELFALEKRLGAPVPRQFCTYTARDGGEPHYGNTQTTPYGEKLVALRAIDLVTELSGHDDVLESTANRAAWAYLGAIAGLRPEPFVALYWR